MTSVQNHLQQSSGSKRKLILMKKLYLFSTTSHPDTISINSLDFTFFKPDIDFAFYDYLIITSKQTINALEQYDREQYICKKALCVSDSSAEYFESLGGSILDSASGYGDDLGSIIKTYPKDVKWLYIHGKVTASDFSKVMLDKGFTIDEHVLYESRCSNEILDVEVEKDAVLIFTSPSSVKCYLKNNQIKQSNKVVVIGKTTAKALPQNVKYEFSEQRSIASCIEKAKTITKI